MTKAFIALCILASSTWAYAGPQNFQCANRLIAVETFDVPHTTPDRMYTPDAKVVVHLVSDETVYEGFSTIAWSPLLTRVTFDVWDVKNSKNAGTLVVSEVESTSRGRPSCGRGGCNDSPFTFPTFKSFAGQLTLSNGEVHNFPCQRK